MEGYQSNKDDLQVSEFGNQVDDNTLHWSRQQEEEEVWKEDGEFPVWGKLNVGCQG